MEKQIRFPLETVLAIVVMLIMAALAVDGVFIQKLPVEALKYPLFCFFVVFATCAIEIVRSIRKQKVIGDKVETKPVHYNKKNFMIMVGLLTAYVILMWLSGFIVSSIALTVVFTLLFKIRRLVLVNIFAAIVVVVIYFVFSNALFIFLPQGLLFKLIF